MNEIPFDPFFLFKTPFRQTIFGSIFHSIIGPKSEKRIITLKDQDKLAFEVITPKKWKEKDLTVVLIHGLCGSHKSPALVRLAKKLKIKNIRSVRVNLRGCGSGSGLAKKPHYSADPEDILEVLKLLKKESSSPIILVGFSLGGNIVLKMVGDIEEEAKKYVKNVIALSPPVDIKLSVELFEKEENKLYLKYFTKLLKEDIKFLKKKFPEFSNIFIPEDFTFTEFNNFFVVSFLGLKDVEEYYKKCSSKYVLSNIKVPCKILFSKDDPIVSYLGLEGVNLPENIQVFLTKKGGHLGYIGSLKDKRGFFWLDNILLDWILNN
ncbi:MAG: hypothetical protein AMS24_02675 [Chlamydiae bacterium SM23_39]|nr:MAG: hypothetical protein AMS24_02675 [Chlamydiae bacterium SM23_39]